MSSADPVKRSLSVWGLPEMNADSAFGHHAAAVAWAAANEFDDVNVDGWPQLDRRLATSHAIDDPTSRRANDWRISSKGARKGFGSPHFVGNAIGQHLGYSGYVSSAQDL